MTSNSFRTGVLLRVGLLFAALAALTWTVINTSWYVSMLLCAVAVLVTLALLIRFASRTGREVARFLDAIAYEDTSVGFAGLMSDRSFRELGTSMTRVLDQLRRGQAEREEQA